MLSHLLISVISDDKPGVVEAIAEAVSAHGGNWLESRLSQLSGKFAGVIRVSVDAGAQDALSSTLAELKSKGIWTSCEPMDAQAASEAVSEHAYIHALGPDRPGIVRELAKTFAHNGINLKELETSLSSMPYSGDPLFEAQGQLQIPEGVDLHALRETLDSIADQLALDISLSDSPFEAQH